MPGTHVSYSISCDGNDRDESLHGLIENCHIYYVRRASNITRQLHTFTKLIYGINSTTGTAIDVTPYLAFPTLTTVTNTYCMRS